MLKRLLLVVPVAAGLGAPAAAWAQPVSGTALDGHGTVAVAPTEAEAEAAFRAARAGYLAVAQGGPAAPAEASPTVAAEDRVAGGQPANVSLEAIRIVLDVENVTLREVMVQIVQQAARYTGPWTVKWRLRPQNADLMEERVNLTAEANFGDFTELLAERVKNMTGVQLYVTAFAAARVLLVTDTYY